VQRIGCWTAIVLTTIGLNACAAPASPQDPGTGQDQQPGPTAATPARTLTLAYRVEPNTVVPKLATPGGTRDVKRLFNASLAFIDTQGTVRPYLAESLPQLNTDSWRVYPDGRMETTYRLRAGLAWHDGAPLTVDDFVFARRVYATSGLGFIAVPQDQMEEVAALDPLTVLIRWSSIYTGAGYLRDTEFEPLPQHLLEAPLAAIEASGGAREAFMNNPYWSAGYVGAGPYRLDHWAQGSEIAGSAFDKHALGRPKIDRIIVRFLGDENAIASNMLAEEVQFVGSFSLGFEYAGVFKRAWAENKRGVVLLHDTAVAYSEFQFRPEYQRTPALLDVRVRRALAHAVDRVALREGLFSGEGDLVETLLSREMPYYPEVERAIARYPHDPQRSEQLMNEAGYAKDRDGFFATAGGERLTPSYRGLTGAIAEREQLLVTDSWRRAGFDIQPTSINVAQVQDLEYRSSHPGISSSQGNVTEASHSRFASSEVSTPARGWRGQNRGGWSNAEYDGLWNSFNSSLERDERNRIMIAMAKLLSEELPAIFLYADIRVQAHLASLRGPERGTPDTLANWNIHEWEWR